MSHLVDFGSTTSLLEAFHAQLRNRDKYIYIHIYIFFFFYQIRSASSLCYQMAVSANVCFDKCKHTVKLCKLETDRLGCLEEKESFCRMR